MKNIYIYILLLSICFSSRAQTPGYVSGDFHQHTTYSDGYFNFGFVMQMNNKYGLDWWANSEHGGAYDRWGLVSGKGWWHPDTYTTEVTWSNAGVTILGKENSGKMWRWQSLRDWSFRDVQTFRQVYPDKTILQGLEWNVPSHEHASVCILTGQYDENPNCSALAEFEYKFDSKDKDDSKGKTFDNKTTLNWTKSTTNDHAKAVAGVTWLQTYHKDRSWIIPAHPEREEGRWTIEALRDLNNAGPDVCFGFESIPGHQKGPNRGDYNSLSYAGKTAGEGKGGSFGGAGYMCAKVGGVWDAMLSEGRRWWLFGNSDFHSTSQYFFPGEYQKTYTYVKNKKDAYSIMEGLKSGNGFVVLGDLINALDFTVGTATMGQTYAADGNTVTLHIRIYTPQTPNNNTYSSYTRPQVDHIDVIAGNISGLIEPTDPRYTQDYVNTTSVIARFDAKGGITDSNNLTSIAWTDQGNGWKEMSIEVPADGHRYYRLRGTNLGLNVSGETDGAGNPLVDPCEDDMGKGNGNSAVKAFADLWFYSNPVFVKNIYYNKTNLSRSIRTFFYPNPIENTLTVETEDSIGNYICIYTQDGIEIKKQKIETNVSVIDVSDLTAGTYLMKIGNNEVNKLLKK